MAQGMNKKRIEAFEQLKEAIKTCKDAGFVVSARYFNDDTGARLVDSVTVETDQMYGDLALVFHANDEAWIEPELMFVDESDEPEFKIEV